jgi:hypothetical protein
MNKLATTLRSQGDYAQARKLEEEVLLIRQQTQGAEHPDTLTSMNNLSIILFHLGKIEKARALVAEALPVALGKYGPDPDFSQGLIQAAIHLGRTRSPPPNPCLTH